MSFSSLSDFNFLLAVTYIDSNGVLHTAPLYTLEPTIVQQYFPDLPAAVGGEYDLSYYLTNGQAFWLDLILLCFEFCYGCYIKLVVGFELFDWYIRIPLFAPPYGYLSGAEMLNDCFKIITRQLLIVLDANIPTLVLIRSCLKLYMNMYILRGYFGYFPRLNPYVMPWAIFIVPIDSIMIPFQLFCPKIGTWAEVGFFVYGWIIGWFLSWSEYLIFLTAKIEKLL
uniref:hypothetical protein n=1 Tax=Fibrocapsa japonica TaxID=94617 RepID=UPI002115BD69|nr:hypothetical protein NQZ09_pgp064 [Fibrocapsa japonica]UTE95241.1 hypothetical protein FjapPt_p160 [Fibrocapsa japonica]